MRKQKLPTKRNLLSLSAEKVRALQLVQKLQPEQLAQVNGGNICDESSFGCMP